MNTSPKPAGKADHLRFDVKLQVLLASSVFAAFGWLISHIVDTHVSVPTLEYSINTWPAPEAPTHYGGTVKSASVTLRNLSRQKKFSDLTLVLHLEPSRTEFCSFLVQEPYDNFVVTSTSPAFGPDDPPKSEKNSVSLEIKEFHPEFELELTGHYSCRQKPTLNLDKTSDTVRMLASSIYTWIIRHELMILTLLVFAWLFVALYAFVRVCRKAGSNANE